MCTLSGNPALDAVLDLLGEAEYVPLQPPLVIGSVPFTFAAVLVKPDRTLDLIAIADLLEDSERRLIQKVSALARALDVAQSRRSLTVVSMGPPLTSECAEVLSGLCRLLPVGTPVRPADSHLLRDALAVLLPLRLPNPTSQVVDPLAQVAAYAPPRYGTELAKIRAGAEHSEVEVRALVGAFLLAPIAQALESVPDA